MIPDAATPPISLDAIKITYQVNGLKSNAIPLYWPSSPEFPLRDRSGVAFPIPQIQATETIFVNIRQIDPQLNNTYITIRAIVANSSPPALIGTLGINIEYGFSAFEGNVGFVPFPVDTATVLSVVKTVGVYQSDWIWQWCPTSDVANPSPAWQTFAATNFNFFLSLDQPNNPWSWNENLYENPGGFPPFGHLMKFACKIAIGATTKLQAIQKITAELRGFFVYDPNPAYTQYVDPETNAVVFPPLANSDLVFFGEGLLDYIMKYYGAGKDANCTDLAHITMLIANALGCGVFVKRITPVTDGGSFALKKATPLGGSPSTEESFEFHEIAYWLDPSVPDAEPLIFDLCLNLYDAAGKETIVDAIPLSAYLQMLLVDPNSVQIQDLSAEIIRFGSPTTEC